MVANASPDISRTHAEILDNARYHALIPNDLFTNRILLTEVFAPFGRFIHSCVMYVMYVGRLAS